MKTALRQALSYATIIGCSLVVVGISLYLATDKGEEEPYLVQSGPVSSPLSQSMSGPLSEPASEPISETVPEPIEYVDKADTSDQQEDSPYVMDRFPNVYEHEKFEHIYLAGYRLFYPDDWILSEDRTEYRSTIQLEKNGNTLQIKQFEGGEGNCHFPDEIPQGVGFFIWDGMGGPYGEYSEIVKSDDIIWRRSYKLFEEGTGKYRVCQQSRGNIDWSGIVEIGWLEVEITQETDETWLEIDKILHQIEIIGDRGIDGDSETEPETEPRWEFYAPAGRGYQHERLSNWSGMEEFVAENGARYCYSYQKYNMLCTVPLGPSDLSSGYSEPEGEPVISTQEVAGRTVERKQWDIYDDLTIYTLHFKDYPDSWNEYNRIEICHEPEYEDEIQHMLDTFEFI